MKKVLIVILMLTVALGLFTACNKEKTLIMATEAGFAPYEYMKGNEIVGVDVDIANEIAKDMGVKLQIDNMEFKSVIPAVASGKADFAAAGLSITEDRLKEVDFTIEYAVSKQVIVVLGNSEITTPDDLTGKSVGVQTGTVADLVITEDYPEIEVVTYDKYAVAVQDLKNNRINAIVMDLLPAQEIIKANEGLVICDEELFTDRYAIAVKKGNKELLDQINSTLQRLIDEGKIAEYTINHTTK